MLAIIGGSGLTRLSTLAVAHREVVRTPYGEPSSALLFGQIGGRDAIETFMLAGVENWIRDESRALDVGE